MKSVQNTLTTILASAITCTVVITGCSDSDSNPAIPIVDTPPQINPPMAFAGSLIQKDTGLTSQFVKNGIYSQYAGQTSSPAAEASDGFTATAYSNTNTQEIGIDEADRIEFDGENFFISTIPVWNGSTGPDANVRVLTVQDDKSLKLTATISTDQQRQTIHGLYLNDETTNKQLAVIRGNYPSYPVDAFVITVPEGEQGPADFEVQLYNVDSADNIGEAERVTIEGNLVSSRRIGNALFVVSTFSPFVEGLVYANDDAAKLENYKKLQEMDDADLMPKVTVNGQSQTLLTIDDCYVPQRASNKDGYGQIIQVTKIDMSAVNSVQALCLSAFTNTTYMSTDSLYLVGTEGNATHIHKIDFDEQLTYSASGSVTGVPGWNSQAHLRLSEVDDTLRILTTDYWSAPNDLIHQLYTLQQNGDELAVVGQLPNDTYPDPIGKPGEDVYAVRYVDNKGYVVTFERTDPLYVIDLSDPALPKLEGALEIPGFSSYLQPFGDNLLLGIGQQVDVDSIPQNGSSTDAPVVIQSMKISLFDVRDPANPLEIDNILKENAYTPVEFDYRALSVFRQGMITQFGLPYEAWRTDSDTNIYSVENGLMMIIVGENEGALGIEERFTVSLQEQSDDYIYGGEDRSVQTESGVYYLRGNDVYYQAYDTTQPLAGPF